MSSGGAFGGARGFQNKAPEKGVFPLDHFGECKQIKDEYLKCLDSNKSQAEKCTGVAKAYLECRMDKNLMARQELKELGLEGLYDTEGIQVTKDQTNVRGQKGFVAGVRMESGIATPDTPPPSAQ